MTLISNIPKPGEISKDVGIMQEALKNRGYSLKVDNNFGPITKKIVSQFQKDKGLIGTGVPGVNTITLLGLSLVSKTITTGYDSDEGTITWYRRMFLSCVIDKGEENKVKNVVDLVNKNINRYTAVGVRLGIPANYQLLFGYIVGAIHYKEASCSFERVLHNGEKIVGTGKKTTIVPAGRGPFTTWEDSAIDAIQVMGSKWQRILSGNTDIGEILYALERYNGTGYITGAGKYENSPYLWACSNINDGYGKYVTDGKFDEDAPTNGTVGAAVILKEIWKENIISVTGISIDDVKKVEVAPEKDTVIGISRDLIASRILAFVAKDIKAGLRETHGKNRSPRIDSFNTRAKSYLGAPYCASALWCAIDDACKELGLKNPVLPTASSQAFRKSSFIPSKYLKSEGSLGKKGDFGVLQTVGNSGQGHLTILTEDQISQPVFKTGEYNTDGSGTRDGDGAYYMSRSTIDRSKANAGKIFVCFTDIPQWILDYNK